MKEHQRYWDELYARNEEAEPRYDDWLVKHSRILELSRDTAIIDLGCGEGGDSLFLTEQGFRVIACDGSEEALRRVRKHIPSIVTKQLNLTDRLPFSADSAKVMIADLSLHYFSWPETINIIKEIERVLEAGGHLLCRVNSVQDVEFGAGQGTELEPNYYEHNGHRKRFFDEGQLNDLFRDWNIVYMRETIMNRYRAPKRLWEIVTSRPIQYKSNPCT